MLCFLFVPAFDYKIYCLLLYHLLKSTLHLKANACSIGTFIRFYMQSSLHSKANACNIGTFIRFYIQMRVQIKNKAFAYRFYRPFTQQWGLGLTPSIGDRRDTVSPLLKTTFNETDCQKVIYVLECDMLRSMHKIFFFHSVFCSSQSLPKVTFDASMSCNYGGAQ